jgi:hypothetical protein
MAKIFRASFLKDEETYLRGVPVVLLIGEGEVDIGDHAG